MTKIFLISIPGCLQIVNWGTHSFLPVLHVSNRVFSVKVLALDSMLTWNLDKGGILQQHT